MNHKTLKNFWPNYLSTMLFLGAAYFIYTNSGFHTDFIAGQVSLGFLDFSLEKKSIFYAILAAYSVLLVPFYLLYPHESKARIVLGYFKKVLQGDGSYTEKERVAFLAWIVKLFFVPLMIVWLSQHIFSLINNWYELFQNRAMFSTSFIEFFDIHLFGALFASILFFDVFFFTVGYLIESPKLKNTIKSVEPTLIGWAVALLCYPPFNNFTGDLFTWYSTDNPAFSNPTIHITMNVILLFLMGIYAWASLALGLKASNLTNRGIVKKGPYKYVRHPAYICKNAAWIIGGFPMLYIAATTTQIPLMSVVFGLSAWTFIYYLRAMTEEAHLSADPDYVQYKKEVKYKFIPGVW